MPMQGKFTQPTATDLDTKVFRFGNSSGGHTKGIVRVKVRDVQPGAPYTLRTHVINQATGEEFMVEAIDLIATHDPDLDF